MSPWWIDEEEQPAPPAPPVELEEPPVVETDNRPEPAPAPPPAPAPAPSSLPEVSPEGRILWDAPRPGSRARSNTYTLVFGKKGAGKTAFAREVFLSRVRAGGSGVFVDPTHRNGDLAAAGNLAAFDAHWRERVRAKRPFAFVVQPGWDDDLNRFWRLVYELGDSLLVIDETDTYATAQRIDPNLERLIGHGRNRQVDILTTVRTPPELSKRIQGNVDVAIAFRQELPDYARDLNARFFRLPDGEARILSLPPLHYLRVQHSRVTGGVVRFSQSAA